LAQEAATQLGLDRVLLIPYAEAPHKRVEPEPGPGLRLEMTRLSIVGDDLLGVSDLEVERGGPSYSFRTLELLRAERPNDELTLLMGADVAARFDGWREPGRIVELARLGIAGRAGAELDDAERVLERLGAARRAEPITMPRIEISSTAIRERIAVGSPVRYLVPDRVLELIAERGLYREAVAA
jgi:nicotinate-nucleotide adenylyltransferase